jgi:hypothetical protein
VDQYVAELRRQEADCLMCDRMRANLLNFTYTIAKLYLDEPEFVTALSASNGFCFHHLQELLTMGVEVVPSRELSGWHETIFALQRRNLDRIRRQLEAFTWQFDYQTDKKTPQEARDVLPRAVQRLAGYGPR